MNRSSYLKDIIRLVCVVTAIYYLFQISPLVFAQETIFQDDFSQGFEKWELVQGTWDTWHISDGWLYGEIFSRSTVSILVPKDEYWQPEWTDYEIDIIYRPMEGVDRNLAWGYQDSGNWYEIHFVDTFFHLVRYKDGNITFNRFEPFVLSNEQTHHFTITYQAEEIVVTLDGQELIREHDQSWIETGGKPALRVGTGAVAPTKIEIDEITVRYLPGNDLIKPEVELLKQTDQRWAEQEYDTAGQWSNIPTIGNWGCALSSLAMVLNYYGFDKLLDGVTLDPGTLDLWLKQQPDGYLGQGMVNWLAGSRLSRLLSEQYSTVEFKLPLLEYSLVTADVEAAVELQINNHQPPILNIPGHFLVASALTPDGNDYLIHDPIYDYTLFSQHQQPLLSARVFEPTYSDLSYLLVEHSAVLSVELVNEDDPDLLTAETVSEILAPHHDSEITSQVVTLTQLRKPLSGQYLLKISQLQLAPFDLKILSYDIQGNPTIFDYQGAVGKQPLIFKLNYSQDIPATLEIDYTWDHFALDLNSVWESRQLTKYYIYHSLDLFTQYAQNAEPSSSFRYVQLLQTYLEWWQDKLDPLVYQFLVERLQLIAVEPIRVPMN